MKQTLKDTLCVINTCFSKEIYEEYQLQQKINNIYFLSENYICENSKIYLVNDGPIDININNNKITTFSTSKRLGRDVDAIKKFIKSLNLYINSDFQNLLWMIDDFYIFESCVKKINSSAEEIFFSKYYKNENLFENFLYVRQNKILINNMIDFLNIKSMTNINVNNLDELTFSIVLDSLSLNSIKLKDSKSINVDLIKSHRLHKNFELLSNQELMDCSIYDLLYQSIGFDGGVYGNNKFFKNV